VIADALGSINAALESLAVKALPAALRARVEELEQQVVALLAVPAGTRSPDECDLVRERAAALAEALENSMRDMQS
jgi:hypothetical protein